MFSKRNPKKIIYIALIIFLLVYKIDGQYISLNTIFGWSKNELFYFPLFVYLLFGYILVSMVTKWKPAVISVKRLAFSPAMFLIMTNPSLINGKYHDYGLLAYLVGIIGIFALSMFIHGKIEIKADKTKKLIAIPADPVIIFATFIVFANGFATGYLSAIHSPIMQNGWLMPSMAFVSGAIAGHRIAKSLSFYLKYRAAQHTDLEM